MCTHNIHAYGEISKIMPETHPIWYNHGVQRRMISVDNFFVFLRLLFFCSVVAICDLVHDVETIFYLSYALTASGNLF